VFALNAHDVGDDHSQILHFFDAHGEFTFVLTLHLPELFLQCIVLGLEVEGGLLLIAQLLPRDLILRLQSIHTCKSFVLCSFQLLVFIFSLLELCFEPLVSFKMLCRLLLDCGKLIII